MNSMHILHYIYGMPPYRGGGMIKYALDLIEVEEKMGHTVSIIYPGSIYKRNSRKIKIKREKNYYKTKVYRIKNPLPIPLGNGIKDFEWFMSEHGYAIYFEFLKNMKPDVIHIHSLMGIHGSFFEAAKQLNIRMVYTSHDYFGLCPITTLMKEKQSCMENNWKKCSICCRNAFSTTHLMLDQSIVVQKVLQTWIGKKTLDLLMHFKAKLIQKSDSIEMQKKNAMYINEVEYQKLNGYYKDILKKIDFYHFNSEISKEEFVKRIGKVTYSVIPITNSSCVDRRKKRSYHSPLKVGFLGGNNDFKGFPVLYKSISDLWHENCKILLNTYFGTIEREEIFWKQNRPYKYSELEKIMDENDVILVPSIWKETFGLVVVEALSFGVPVIVSENVGAKIFLERKGEIGKVLKGNLYLEIKKCLREITVDRSILEKWNANICEADFDFSMEKHGKKIVNICYEEKYDEK